MIHVVFALILILYFARIFLMKSSFLKLKIISVVIGCIVVQSFAWYKRNFATPHKRVLIKKSEFPNKTICVNLNSTVSDAIIYRFYMQFMSYHTFFFFF